MNNSEDIVKENLDNNDNVEENAESKQPLAPDVDDSNSIVETPHSPETEAPQNNAAPENVEVLAASAAVKVDSADAHLSSQNSLVNDHEAIIKMFGLKLDYEARAKTAKLEHERTSGKSIAIIIAALAVIGVAATLYFLGDQAIDEKEQAEFVAKKQREIEAEEARRNRIEYAEIAFLDSLPERVAISMDGKPQYAKTQDGSFTELRAGKNTWIRFLPIKESTIVQFDFVSEGFKPLSRKIAYYDWFPANKESITLQKVFRKVVLEPDVTPRIPSCEGEACEWTVFREIMFRAKYAETSAIAIVDEKDKAKNRDRVLKTHPALAQSAGLDPANLPADDTKLGLAAQNLLQYIDKHPYALYGSITVVSDVPDTRVTFLGEPLMIVKDSGSMSQVRVDPEHPFVFSTYGQGHPITISEPLSIRLEAQGYPSYVTEILPTQWHCEPVAAELIAQLEPPAFTQMDDYKADFRHFVCDYSVEVKANFAAIREVEQQMKHNESPEQ